MSLWCRHTNSCLHKKSMKLTGEHPKSFQWGHWNGVLQLLYITYSCKKTCTLCYNNERFEIIFLCNNFYWKTWEINVNGVYINNTLCYTLCENVIWNCNLLCSLIRVSKKALKLRWSIYINKYTHNINISIECGLFV